MISQKLTEKRHQNLEVGREKSGGKGRKKKSTDKYARIEKGKTDTGSSESIRPDCTISQRDVKY